jgi:hypothetical protein
MVANAVEVDLRSIRRAWRAVDVGEFWAQTFGPLARGHRMVSHG